jgi:hypothetical protein
MPKDSNTLGPKGTAKKIADKKKRKEEAEALQELSGSEAQLTEEQQRKVRSALKLWSDEPLDPSDFNVIIDTSTSEVKEVHDLRGLFQRKSIVQELQEILSEKVMYQPVGGAPMTGTRQTFMLQAAVERAMLGDKDSLKFITSYVEGNPIQRSIVANIDVVSEVVKIVERLVGDNPVLMKMFIYEFRKLGTKIDPDMGL